MHLLRRHGTVFEEHIRAKGGHPLRLGFSKLSDAVAVVDGDGHLHGWPLGSSRPIKGTMPQSWDAGPALADPTGQWLLQSVPEVNARVFHRQSQRPASVPLLGYSAIAGFHFRPESAKWMHGPEGRLEELVLRGSSRIPFGAPETAPAWLNQFVTIASGLREAPAAAMPQTKGAAANESGGFETVLLDERVQLWREFRERYFKSIQRGRQPQWVLGDPEWERLLKWWAVFPEKRAELP